MKEMESLNIKGDGFSTPSGINTISPRVPP